MASFKEDSSSKTQGDKTKSTMNPNYKSTIDKIKRSKTRVTIVTPTYNRADLIEFAMKSVLAQSYEDYKYIIIDDGSTDDTRKVVQEFIKNKKNCFYLYHDNIGEAETVNVGWSLCNSDYFVQVNSDDTVEPDLLSEMVGVLDENPKCVVAYPDFYIIDQAGKITENFKNVDWNFIDALSAFSCYAAAPGAFIRKTAFKELDKIKDSKYKYINDVKMLWNMALKGDFIHVPKSLASWRSHDDGISINRYKSIGEVVAWADEYFSQKNLPEDVKNAEKICRQSIDRHCLRLIANSKAENVVVDFIKYFIKNHQSLIEESELLRVENQSLESQNQSLESQNQSLESQNHELIKKNEMLEQSISWRATRPLREISNYLRRFKI